MIIMNTYIYICVCLHLQRLYRDHHIQFTVIAHELLCILLVLSSWVSLSAEMYLSENVRHVRICFTLHIVVVVTDIVNEGRTFSAYFTFIFIVIYYYFTLTICESYLFSFSLANVVNYYLVSHWTLIRHLYLLFGYFASHVFLSIFVFHILKTTTQPSTGPSIQFPNSIYFPRQAWIATWSMKSCLIGWFR